MRSRWFAWIALLPLLGLSGCSVLHPSAPPPPAAPGKGQPVNVALRHNAGALLADLLGDEKNLGKLLIVKRESAELKRLVKDISETAAHGEKLLRSLAKVEPGLDLDAVNLPPGEVAARKAIAKATQYQLLHSSGAEFERELLLAQVQALSYARHLSAIVATNVADAARAREFVDLSNQFQRLHQETLTLLAHRP